MTIKCQPLWAAVWPVELYARTLVHSHNNFFMTFHACDSVTRGWWSFNHVKIVKSLLCPFGISTLEHGNSFKVGRTGTHTCTPFAHTHTHTKNSDDGRWFQNNWFNCSSKRKITEFGSIYLWLEKPDVANNTIFFSIIPYIIISFTFMRWFYFMCNNLVYLCYSHLHDFYWNNCRTCEWRN